MRAGLAIALVLAIQTLPLVARAAPAAPTLALAVGPAATTRELSRSISDALRASKRLNLAPPVAFQEIDLALPEALKRLRKLTRADLVLVAVNRPGAAGAPGELVSRLYDLKLGDVSRPFRHRLSPEGARSVARQLLLTIRNRYPLRAEVLGLDDGLVLLDIGSEDGVASGDSYVLAPRRDDLEAMLTRLTVVRTEAWYCWASRASGSLPVRNVQSRPKPWLSGGGGLPVSAVPWAVPGDPVTEDIRVPWPEATGSTPVATP
jgi:hypothetical protein